MDSSRKREKIEKIAFRLFLEKGYNETGIREICAKAGIEAPTLYYFYGSKKGLFFYLAKKLHTKFLSTNNDMAIFNPDENPEEALYNMLQNRIVFTANHTMETRFYLRYTLFPPQELKEDIQKFIAETSAAKKEFAFRCFTECKRRGLIKVEAEVAVKYFLKFINNNAFDIIFSGWNPSQAEIKNLWEMFFKCRLAKTVVNE